MKLIIEIDEKQYEYCKQKIIGIELNYDLNEAIANGTPITELSDNIFANILLSEINKKGLAFEEVLLLLDKANVISTSCSKLKEETESELKAGDIVTTPGGIRAIIIGIEEWNNTKLASIYSEYYALPQMFPVQDLKATGVHKDVKSMLLDLLKENANEQDS